MEHRRPFNVKEIKDEPETPIEAEIAMLAQQAGAERQKLAQGTVSTPRPTTEVEQGAMVVIRKEITDHTTITFVEDEGYLILRIASEGKSQDLIMNPDQIKLLLRQMALWVTR